MERPLDQIYAILQALMGLHRQLLDLVRAEREALAQASLKSIQETTDAKQGLIQEIQQREVERQRWMVELGAKLRIPSKELSLSQIIIAVQGRDPKAAEQLRSSRQALKILVERIQEQNDYNRAFVERSLEHVRDMKRNAFQEAAPRAGTYTASGQKQTPAPGPNLVSSEA